MNDFIMPLNSQAATLAIAGGKGANLAKLIEAPFHVPPGFIITTAAYHTFVRANKLADQIIKHCRSIRNNDPASYEAASYSIRELFYASPIPKDISEEIIEGYEELGAKGIKRSGDDSLSISAEKIPASQDDTANRPLVAVRSSATVEDLPDLSFAGLHDSFLNVKGESSLLDAVKACWASLWTARAMSYRDFYDLNSPSIGQAVIVQQMVEADISGVLFTINSMNGGDTEVIINAARGLGTSVVSGLETPHMLTVDKATGQVDQIDLDEKAEMPEHTTSDRVKMTADSGLHQPSLLDEEQITMLTDLGNMVEEYFGAPQDIEWAISDGLIYLLQSRPITNVFPTTTTTQTFHSTSDALNVSGDDDWPVLGGWPIHDYDCWTRANLGELWHDPVSPLVASSIPMIISEAVHHALQGVKPKLLHQTQWAKRFYGRIYYNEGALRYILSEELGLPANIMDRSWGSQFRANQSRDQNKIHFLKILRHLPVLRRLAVRQWRTGHALETYIIEIDRWVDDFLKIDSFEQADSKLWAEVMVWLGRIAHAVKLQNEMSGYAQTLVGLLERLMSRWFKRPELVLDLITGLPGIQSTEMATDLSKIAQKIDSLDLTHLILENDPDIVLNQIYQMPVAESVSKMLDSFLNTYGYRCPNEAEWLHPRWRDDPAQVIDIVAGYLRSGKYPDQLEREARKRRQETTKWVENQVGPLRRKLFHKILPRAQHAVRLRDNGKSHVIKVTYPARHIAVIFGQRWTEQGWLKQPEDIFFLTIPDIGKIINAGDPRTAGYQLHKLVAGRRTAFEYWFEVSAPDAFDQNGRPLTVESDESRKSTLQGVSAGRGSVRGVARIIHDPKQITRMKPDEILVTKATDTGWGASFLLVAGVVTEIGGQLSHAAILAREIGLPIIVNVQNATRCIHDGQIITIDCGTGCVYLE